MPESKYWQLSLKGMGIVEGLDDVKQSIQIILTTQKGSNPARPLFGVGVYGWIDKPMNVAIPNIKLEIIKGIQLYEPRAKLTSITHTVIDSNLRFKIHWKLADGSDGENSITYERT